MVICTEQKALVEEGIGLVILATEYEVQQHTTAQHNIAHHFTPHHIIHERDNTCTYLQDQISQYLRFQRLLFLHRMRAEYPGCLLDGVTSVVYCKIGSREM
jgi:hypothetical protein